MTHSSFVIVIILCLGPLLAFAQTNDGSTIPGDETIQNIAQSNTKPIDQKEKVKGKFKANWHLPYPNPYRAGIYSMVLPGAGQIYNKKYWKLPIVWGGFGALIYSVDYNKTQRDRFDEAYGASAVGLPNEFEGVLNTQALRNYRDKFSKQLQLTYIGFVALYVVTALDAYVDAHLKSFDIGDDLSLHLNPTITPEINTGRFSPGLGVVLRFE